MISSQESVDIRNIVLPSGEIAGKSISRQFILARLEGHSVLIFLLHLILYI
jgi:hypothetical protein